MLMAEFKCYKCGEINEVDLSQIDITEEFINQGFEESAAEIEKLEASNKALELKLERTIKGLEDSKSGISKAISKTKDQSVEIQGEVAEELLQSNLEEAFPNDSFVPIKKGQRGADIKQVIFTEGGYEAGSILFESKNTKNMVEAAYYSGKAINISKTTLPHALSYFLTIKYNVSDPRSCISS